MRRRILAGKRGWRWIRGAPDDGEAGGRGDRPTGDVADAKADKEWLIKGAMCVLIGLVVLLSPGFIRVPGLRGATRCGALIGDGPYPCVIYAERPEACRELEAGGDACALARRRVGLEPWPDGVTPDGAWFARPA